MRPWHAALAVFTACSLGCIALDFSPDGKTLAFAWPLDNDTGLALIGTDGTSFKYVSAGDGTLAKWSPNGRQIAYTSDEGVRVLDVASGRSTLVVPDGGGRVAWSEDGRKLATLVRVEESNDRYQVLWYDLDAKAVTLRSPTPPIDPNSASFFGLVWIPRNSGLAFVASSSSGSDVYLMEAGETRRLTTTGDVIGLALEPGGRRLVWARESRNPKYILLTLYAFDLVDRGVARLPFPERVKGVNPAPRTGPKSVDLVRFAPDLSQMLVWTTSDSGSGNGNVYCIRRDGSGAFVVGKTAKDNKVESILMATWSPDGTRIASLWASDKTWRLQIQASDGSGAKTLRTQRAK